MGVTLDLSNPVLRDFGFYCAVLVLKMLFMSAWTGKNRMSKGIFITAEDVMLDPSKGKADIKDENIERIRRAHQNDLENISLFFIIGALYVLSDPCAWIAKIVFLVYTAARIGHTVFYLNAIQPYRAQCFLVGVLATFFMAINVLSAFL